MQNKRKLHNILVTGGAGFIGCNFIHYLFGMSAAGGEAFTDAGFDGIVVNADLLTYAGNLSSLKDVDEKFGSGAAEGAQRYFFEKIDICDRENVAQIFSKYDIDTVVHFAAESHVDRSIVGPEAFVRTNVMGTFTLLDAAHTAWKKADGSLRDDVVFHHISTDEVYGSLGETGFFTETTPYEQGIKRPPCRIVFSHVWTAADAFQLHEQLRSVSIPRKTHSVDDYEYKGRKKSSRVRRRQKYPRLDLR